MGNSNIMSAVFHDPATQIRDELKGKELRTLRTRHTEPNYTPHLALEFKDGSAYELRANDDVFIEGIFINTVRQARPIEIVLMMHDGYSGLFILEVKDALGAQFQVRTRLRNPEQFPLYLERVS